MIKESKVGYVALPGASSPRMRRRIAGSRRVALTVEDEVVGMR